MRIKTERLEIVDLDISMAKDVYLLSQDEDMQKYLPDEIFNSEKEAKEMIISLLTFYETKNGPLIYPILLANKYIGYVEIVPLQDKWEIGYHIGKAYTKNGYANEAIKAFLPVIMDELDIDEVIGVCVSENISSIKVLEKCGFVKYFEGISKYLGKEREICKYRYLKTDH